MASWFRLGLDTHAPVVTFGAADSSGGALAVPYTIDEPAIDSAWVVDANGRRVELDVQPSRLFAVLPADIAAGNAIVHAHAVDDVGNAAEYTTGVLLAGAVVPPTTPVVRGGPPPPVQPRPRKFITSRSRLRGDCPATVRRSVARTVSGVGTSSSATAATRASTRSSLAAGSSARASAVIHVADATSAAAGLTSVSVRRRDGRGIEEALLLDLL